MKFNFTMRKARPFFVSQLVVLVLFSFYSSFGTMVVTVNGQVNGAYFQQGGFFQWNISGISNGATVINELWIDLNSNNVIDPGTDLLFVNFNQTDGVSGGNQGPGDDDATANGIIATGMEGLSFPAAHYIFKSKFQTDSAQATFTMLPLSSPTFTVSGKVTYNSIGVANVVVRLQLESSSNTEFYTLTDATGSYTVSSTLPSGTAVRLNVPMESFNPTFSKYIVSPSEYQFTLNSNLTGMNFVFNTGKTVTGRVTDTLGNPIQDLQVSIYPHNGGNGYDGRTDNNGRYFISVDTGTYTVQFGNDREPKGYIKTYYNQKYVGWNSDYIHVTLATDTLKNINAVLRRGGYIRGTFTNNGVSVRGNISAFAYNAPGSALYEAWHDSTDNYYYLIVPPGVYTIQFNLENNGGMGTQVYYNQTQQWPGTPVTVQSFSDTVKNINVEFSSVPKTYMFFGWGNWNDVYNWNNMQKPPATLPPGDTIIINGQCTLNSEQHISNGAYLIIATGGNLIIPGSLTVHKP